MSNNAGSRTLHASVAFERVLAYCRKLAISDGLMGEIEQKLNYFRVQSLSHTETKDRMTALRQRWAELEALTGPLGIFDECRKNQEVWQAISAFLGPRDPRDSAPQFKSLRKPTRDSAQPPGRDARDFFCDLKAKVAVSQSLPPHEKQLIKLGLNHLSTEADRLPTQRNRVEIRDSWKTIWPYLNKYRFLDEYRKDMTLKRSIELFMADEPPNTADAAKSTNVWRLRSPKG